MCCYEEYDGMTTNAVAKKRIAPNEILSGKANTLDEHSSHSSRAFALCVLVQMWEFRMTKEKIKFEINFFFDDDDFSFFLLD